MQVSTLTTSDLVLMGSSLFLGAAALFVPYLAEKLKRSYFAPALLLDFALSPPDCHLTRSKGRDQLGRVVIDEPDYYFRFRVQNQGQSQARRCEAVVESMYIADASGKFQPLPQFTPVTLIWGSGYVTEFVDINPERRFFCDLCHIPSAKLQALELNAGKYVDPTGTGPFDVGVVLNVKTAFHSQPNRLSPGKYCLDVAIYSENARTIRRRFQISWSGAWKDTEQLMFREAVVELVDA
ncbi:MAG: hypothetical protein A3G24_26280 [Betaproteobacteria bacterium RIFCSPLOWO2_12_FULL_62_13]|nr:MAG: hypothetical protein A3G24_26280 [Betaproteobacteria bacterium RIFCSPLOWO2_12_FULL_62_13]